jgi:FkbM family methyltransferase
MDLNQAAKPRLIRGAWRLYRGLAANPLARKIGDIRIGGATLGGLADRLVRRMIFAPVSSPVLAVIHGHKMWLPARGTPDFLLQPYEEGTTRLFCRLVQEGMLVVDVGAHVGYYALLAADQVGATGRVYAFEPEPTNYALLLKNIKLNRYTNIVAVQAAISDKSGPSSLFLGRHSGSHSLFESADMSGTVVNVQATSLDDFFEREGWPRIHVMKVDVEGAEMAVLDGMSRLATNVGHLIIELDAARLRAASTTPEALLRRLLRLGFDVQVIDERIGCTPLDVPSLLRRLRVARSVNLFCEKANPT